MSGTGISRVARTLVHLHPQQVLARLSGLFGPGLPRVTAGALPQGFPRAGSFARFGLHDAGPKGRRAADEIRRGVFSLYGWSKPLGYPGTDWLPGERTRDRLFATALHYHGFAPALARHDKPLFKALMLDWMERCGPGQRPALPLAWNPYATATRVAHWCRAYAAAGPAFWQGEPAFAARFFDSLSLQGAYVRANPELRLMGNHLIRDALGTACRRALFGIAAGRREDEARTLHWAEGQVLPDFAHSERSPMYHAQVMEDLELVRGLSGPDASARLGALVAGMRGVLAWMRHPDGGIPLLNDSALNGAAHPSRFGLGPVPRGSLHLKEGGLFIHHGPRISLFFDLGEIGDRWQPGHAHADSLTFECSWRGERLIVDPGTYGYDDDGRRAYDRSTAAHNTLCVDGRDSSECWAIFRVGRRARPLAAASAAGAEPWAEAGHDGYRFLPGRPVHTRRVGVGRDSLSVRDGVRGSGRHSVQGGLLLAPGWRATARPGGWELAKAGTRLTVRLSGPKELRLSLRERHYHPEFGVEKTVQRLEFEWKGELPLALTWSISER